MTVFGIGTTELVLILLLLILIFGPQKITEMGMWLGQTYKKIAGISEELNQQVGEVRSTVKTAMNTADAANPLKEAVDEMKSLQKDVNKEISAAKKDVEKRITSTKLEMEEQISSVEKALDSQVNEVEGSSNESAAGAENKPVTGEDPA